MGNNITLDDKSHHNEQRLEYQYITDIATVFNYKELSADANEVSRVLTQNAIVFMIEGSCSFSYDHYINRMFFAGNMLFFPKSAMVTGIILENTKFLYMTFDMPLSICDRQYIQQQWEIVRNITYDFIPLKINYPVGIFINSMVYLIQNGGDCAELYEVKHKELFITLRLFYSKEQFAELFYPIIGESYNFKNFILKNYINCYNLKELIARSNMCPNVFMRKFKEEFGMSGYQWILKQMCKRIQHKASQPGISIKEIMREVGIESPSHFNRVCKRYFDRTPKQLISHCQKGLPLK